MQLINPHQLKQFLSDSTIDTVMQQAEISKSITLSQQIQSLWQFCAERPRWQNWFSQITRSSTSVALNLSQAWGKGRGHFISDYLIARGELFETATALKIGPRDVCGPLISLALEICKIVQERLECLHK